MSAAARFAAFLAQQTEAEQHDNIEAIRRCFEGLLTEFPLSYGHWKRCELAPWSAMRISKHHLQSACGRYADHEVRHGNLERATEVYERGVQAATYCVELWSFYAAHAVAHWSGQPDKVAAAPRARAHAAPARCSPRGRGGRCERFSSGPWTRWAPTT